ncbi:unnamed protein product [Clonostachys chloroleuca]|uniref:Beta-lactamase-related domain-containing protein n=1 Tax=Clonostachys chloroleuca TaxID=1926264 RepID=A0AA35LQA0_9HYPO|nr:unnamed protein product [Clonostachys chloroleuca]
MIRMLSALALVPTLGVAELICGPSGPVLPRQAISSLSSSPILQQAAANLTSSLNAAINGNITAGWETKNASFSIGLISANQSDAKVPIWEFHHRAEANTRGTLEVGRDSQYLVGSISKAISDYILLRSGIDIDTPVTEFLPKLTETESIIQWNQVTLRMLGSHLAGVPANYGFSEYYYLKKLFISSGLPDIDDSEYPPCGVGGLNGPCSQDDFLNGMRTQYPVTATNERPSYSNIAFTLMFMAVEAQTGKNYTQLVNEFIGEELGMTSTFPSPGDDEKAVIPPGESTWGGNYGFDAPAGGLVSTISDLGQFCHRILTRTLPLTGAQTRGWLKPSSVAGNPSTQVGMPWEIYQTSDLTPDHPHPVSVYGKGGGAMSYRSQLSIIDEYGIGLVVLTAGPMNSITLINNAALSVLVPAIDEAARIYAQANYATTFKTADGQDGKDSLSVSFSLDQDSLLVSNITRGETDVLAGLVNIWSVTVGGYVAPVSSPFRLFPTELNTHTTLGDGTPVKVETWRMQPTLSFKTDSQLPGVGLDARTCFQWTVGDWVHYGGEPTDRVLFYRDGEDRIVGFEAPFMRSGILRPN